MLQIILTALLMVYVAEAETEALLEDKTSDHNEEQLLPDLQEDYSKCGITMYTYLRIALGSLISRGIFPWMANIYNGDRLICFGSIITPTHILTSASCVHSLTSAGKRNLNVRVGVDRLDELQDPESEVKGVKLILKNKLFSFQTMDNNVAVIVLDSPITYTSNVRPICLPEPGQDTFEGQRVYQPGIDMLNNNSNAHVFLYKQELVVLSQDECQEIAANKSLPIKISPSMLCARRKSRCMRDGGNPLVYQTLDDTYVQVGIHNSFFGCLVQDFPDVFTRVTAVRDWIDKALAYKKQ